MLITKYDAPIKYMERIFQKNQYLIPILEPNETKYIIITNNNNISIEEINENKLKQITTNTRHKYPTKESEEKNLQIIKQYYPKNHLKLILPQIKNIEWKPFLKYLNKIETNQEIINILNIGKFIKKEIKKSITKTFIINIEWKLNNKLEQIPTININNITITETKESNHDKESNILAKVLKGLFQPYDARFYTIEQCEDTKFNYLKKTMKLLEYEIEWISETKKISTFQIKQI